MKKHVLVIIFALSLITQLVAAEPQGTLRIAISTMPNILELAEVADKNASNASWPLYNSLVWIDETGKVAPMLAESWELADDGTVYTMKLRQGVTFHNGDPFTADDVIFSWKRGSQPEMPYSDKWLLAKSIEKIDDFTIKITTEGPQPLFLSQVAWNWGGMLPKNHIEKVGEEAFARHPIGTGPFRFVKWLKGDRIVYEANPDYWIEDQPKVQEVIFRPIPESATRVAAIQTGQIDIAARLSAEEATSLEGNPNVKVITYPIDRVYYIAFNNLTTGKGLPTESPLVRQAMNYAVDVEIIIDALFNGHGRQATGFVSTVNWVHDKELKPFGYDPDKARELLAEAGYPDGFEMDFACPSGSYANFEQVCEAIQGFLGEVGIQTTLELMESGKYWDLEAKKELPPLFGDSWADTTGESFGRLEGALGGMNASYSAWSDPKIDELLGKIKTTMDDEARAQLYIELQRYMQESPPFIYLYEPVTFEAINPKVQNYRPRPAEDFLLPTVSISE